ncbi:MAG: PD40 domain-containing protein, partial [Candidatus Delongbacteria bacterium]|nr:PD40 domain-containing protein [Candidatus Delongbacteria bacterium]
MKRYLLVWIMLWVGLVGFSMGADLREVRFFQFPDIEGNQITFCYNNDIYVVDENGGTAVRLTSHIGEERFPKFSPDGQTIAFTAEYLGGANVFSVPVTGGEIKQLTYYPSEDKVVDWSRDGKQVLFTSARNSFVRFFTKFFLTSPDGGLPIELAIDKGSQGTFSPDGKQFLYTRHSDRYWWWKRYRGSANLDLWMYDMEKKSFSRLTDYPGNDMWPMWGFDGYYFVSDRDGINNIYRMNPTDKTVTRITDAKFDGVSWASIDSKGEKIVYLNDGLIVKLDLKTKQVQSITISLQADPHLDNVEFITPESAGGQVDISPTGKRILNCIRGEIFSLPVEEGIIRNYSQSSGTREKLATWSPDGKTIAFISDRSGDEEIFLVDQMNKEKPKQVTHTGGFKNAIEWASDSKKLLYATNERKLYYVDIPSGKSILIDSSDVDDMYDFNWSPDSRWVTYIKTMRNKANQIRLYDLEKTTITTLKLEEDYYDNPRFTMDGKGLVFFRSHMASPTLKTGYYMALAKGGKPLNALKNDEETGKLDDDSKAKDDDGEDEENGDTKKKKDKDKVSAPKLVNVVIDFNGLEDRIEPIENLRGRFDNMIMTDKYYYFMKLESGGWHSMFRRISLSYYDIKEKEVKKAYDDIDNYAMAAKKQKLVVYTNGKLKVLKVGTSSSAKKADPEMSLAKKKKEFIDLSGVRLCLNHQDEWKQIYNEAWRLIKYNFYDPNFHGVNWDSIGNYYKKFLPYIASRQELNILLQRMIGELNASHQGAYGGDFYGQNYKEPTYAVGLLGTEFELDKASGMYRFAKIFKGEDSRIVLNSPLDRYYHDIKPGDYLLAINGQRLTASDNPYYYLLLNGKKARVTLTYNSKPTEVGAKEIVVAPALLESELKYKEWSDRNTGLVDSLSNNQIGYIHLKDMSSGGWDEFKQKIKEYRYKEAIIIDVRYNGGGSIDPEIIDVLERQKYMTTRERNGFLEERPDDGFYGKLVVLCNEYSYSDAEVFPRAFQIRKLGKVIGMPTLGFVIAVTDVRMIDGGGVRKTFIGIWDNEGKMMESVGVQPDIVVENSPEDELAGRDNQLLKAIEVLQEDIRANPRPKTYP